MLNLPSSLFSIAASGCGLTGLGSVISIVIDHKPFKKAEINHKINSMAWATTASGSAMLIGAMGTATYLDFPKVDEYINSLSTQELKSLATQLEKFENGQIESSDLQKQMILLDDKEGEFDHENIDDCRKEALTDYVKALPIGDYLNVKDNLLMAAERQEKQELEDQMKRINKK